MPAMSGREVVSVVFMRSTSLAKAAAILGLLLVLAALASAVASAGERYRIDAGDLLSIKVYGEDDLSLPEIRVPANGRIAVPLLGEVIVRGLTVGELEDKLVRLFKDGYLKRPEVTVNILEYRPFFVNGEVKSPGAYPYADGMNVRKAISVAGGKTERASGKVLIVREGEAEVDARRVDMDTPVNPGDVVTVDESIF